MNADRLYSLGFLVLLIGALCFAGYALRQGRTDLAATAFAAAVGLVAPPPRGTAAPAQPSAPRPPILPLLLLCLGLSACAGGMSIAIREAIQCGPVAAGLAAEVAAALKADDWTAQLDRLVKAAGNTAICAINAAGQAAPVAGAGLAPASVAVGTEEAEHARRYLAQGGWIVR